MLYLQLHNLPDLDTVTNRLENEHHLSKPHLSRHEYRKIISVGDTRALFPVMEIIQSGK
jgi:hypothetical protein